MILLTKCSCDSLNHCEENTDVFPSSGFVFFRDQANDYKPPCEEPKSSPPMNSGERGHLALFATHRIEIDIYPFPLASFVRRAGAQFAGLQIDLWPSPIDVLYCQVFVVSSDWK